MYLSKDVERSKVICWIVESQVPVQTTDSIEFALSQVEARNLKVLLQAFGVVALGNDCETSLGSPSQENLRRSLAVLRRQFRNLWVLK